MALEDLESLLLIDQSRADVDELNPVHRVYEISVLETHSRQDAITNLRRMHTIWFKEFVHNGFETSRITDRIAEQNYSYSNDVLARYK